MTFTLFFRPNKKLIRWRDNCGVRCAGMAFHLSRTLAIKAALLAGLLLIFFNLIGLRLEIKFDRSPINLGHTRWDETPLNNVLIFAVARWIIETFSASSALLSALNDANSIIDWEIIRKKMSSDCQSKNLVTDFSMIDLSGVDWTGPTSAWISSNIFVFYF